jgi:hypothetical protein
LADVSSFHKSAYFCMYVNSSRFRPFSLHPEAVLPVTY